MAIAIPFSDRVDIRQLGTNGQWTTITLPDVPAGATGVIVSFYGNVTNDSAEGAIRTIGCPIDGNNAYRLGTRGDNNQLNHSQHWAEMDGSNQVEMWVNANCTYASITGWLEGDDDVNFLDPCLNMWDYLESGDGTTPETDHTFDLSSISGGASAVLVVSRGTTIDGNAKYNWKRPSESYWRPNVRRGDTATTFVYPLDGSGKVTFKFSHYTPTFVIIGFMGSNFTPYTTSPENNLIADGSWGIVELANTSQSATIAVLDHDTNGAVWGGVQAVGQPARSVADFWGFGGQYFAQLDALKQYQHYFVDAIHVDSYTYCVGWFDPASLPTGPNITSVNTNNNVADGAGVTLGGSFPTTVTSVKLINGAMETTLSISSQTGTSVVCSALDVFAGDVPFGSAQVEASDGTDSDTHTVTVLPGSNFIYTTLVDPILATGLVKELTTSAGQQIAVESGASGSVNTLYDDSDMLLNPAAVNGQTYTRQHHDGSTWNEDTITIYRGSFTGVSWTGVPSPPNAVVGKQYDYVFGGMVSGDRPITYTLETGQLPDGLTIDSTAEKITGIALEAVSFTGLSITADNTVATATIQVLGDDV